MPGVVALSGGGGVERLAAMLETAMADGPVGVISFGIAGGLAPDLKPGATILGRRVLDGETRFEADPAWIRRLAAALPHATVAAIAGVDEAVADADAKRLLHRAGGAVAVDMESHVAARIAARHGLPFAALRVVADPAERSLPRAAMAGMRPDGSADINAVLRALARAPHELPALLRVAADARAAFAALRSSRFALHESGSGSDQAEGRPAMIIPDRPGSRA